MAIRINSNVESVFAQKHLARTQRQLRKTTEQLSSGLRINRAADDAAGLAVSEKMRAQIKSLKVASRNAGNAISMVQTGEGALHETANLLSRMRELAVEASSEVLQGTERAYLQTEFSNLQLEVERIAQTTEFSGLNLTDGVVTQVDVQVGIFNVAAQDRITVNLVDATASSLQVSSSTMDINSASTAQSAITDLDTAIVSVNTARADFGASQNRLNSVIRNLENYTENLVEAESRIRDVDFAAASAQNTRHQILQQAGISVLSQANIAPQAALALLS